MLSRIVQEPSTVPMTLGTDTWGPHSVTTFFCEKRALQDSYMVLKTSHPYWSSGRLRGVTYKLKFINIIIYKIYKLKLYLVIIKIIIDSNKVSLFLHVIITTMPSYYYFDINKYQVP